MNPIDWLLDSDPAIRWQAMRDLTDAAPAAVAAERARVAREGLGADMLARQGDDGAWHRAGDPDWIPTLYTPLILRAQERALVVPQHHLRARRAARARARRRREREADGRV